MSDLRKFNYSRIQFAISWFSIVKFKVAGNIYTNNEMKNDSTASRLRI